MRSSCEASATKRRRRSSDACALGEGELDLVDHAVERLGELARLGARRGGLEAAAQVAGGDLVGGAHEVVDGPQPEADHPPRHEGEHEQHRAGGGEGERR